MSDLLTVATNFGSISELAQGLADRIEGEQLILYGPSSYSEGAEVPFAVLLADGSPVIAGVGRVAASVDGGEERAPETRFDVVLDSLRLEPRAEVVYERILLELQPEGEPTGQVALDKVESEIAEAAPASEDADFPVEDFASAPAAEEPVAAASDLETEFADDEAWTADAKTPVGVASDDVDAELDRLTDGLEASADLPLANGEPYEAATNGEWTASGEAYAETPAEALDGVGSEPAFDVSETEYAASATEPPPSEPAYASEPPAAFEASNSYSARPAAVPPSAENAPPGRPAPEAPVSPGGFELPTLASGAIPVLSREVLGSSWSPIAAPAPEPEPESAVFAYAPGELPVPARPPRPDLDPSLRVSPAPRPATEAAFAAAAYVEETAEAAPVVAKIPRDDLDEADEFADDLEMEGVEAERQWED